MDETVFQSVQPFPHNFWHFTDMLRPVDATFTHFSLDYIENSHNLSKNTVQCSPVACQQIRDSSVCRRVPPKVCNCLLPKPKTTLTSLGSSADGLSAQSLALCCCVSLLGLPEIWLPSSSDRELCSNKSFYLFYLNAIDVTFPDFCRYSSTGTLFHLHSTVETNAFAFCLLPRKLSALRLSSDETFVSKLSCHALLVCLI